MVKIMCREKAKSGFNPIFTTVVWLVSTYLFSLIWGICQIIFEFEFNLGKHLICFGATVFYAWYLISRLLTEFEFCVEGDKLNISKTLSKRVTPIKIISLSNITDVCKSKKYKTYRVKKFKNLTRPGQKGEPVYVVYKSGDTFSAIKIKPGKELLGAIKQKNTNKNREEH